MFNFDCKRTHSIFPRDYPFMSNNNVYQNKRLIYTLISLREHTQVPEF